MDDTKKRIVMEFLRHGVLLSPDELKQITPENYKEILLSRLKNTETSVSISIERIHNNVVEINEFIKRQLEGFEYLRKELSRKIEAISIEKAKTITGDTCVIGVVVKRVGSGYILEDVTGKIEVIPGEEHNLKEGDVVGIGGVIRGGKMFAKTIIYPDVPLTKSNQTHTNIQISVEYSDMIEIKVDGIKRRTDSDVYVSITKGKERVIILIIKITDNIKKEDIIYFLRKRIIKTGNPVKDFVLKKIPDVLIVVNNKDNWKFNYKGVAIILLKRGSEVIYDMKSGTTSFRDV